VKKADIEIGKTYVVKVSGILAPVRITGESRYGGFDGVNTKTGRTIRIKSAQRIRRLWVDHKARDEADKEVRELIIDGYRRISVKGSGFTTYWMGHGDSQYDGIWLLAGQQMREKIDKVDKA